MYTNNLCLYGQHLLEFTKQRLSLSLPEARKYTSDNVTTIHQASWNVRTKTLKIIFCLSLPMTSAQNQSSKPAWGQFYQSPATPVYKSSIILHATLHLIRKAVAKIMRNISAQRHSIRRFIPSLTYTIIPSGFWRSFFFFADAGIKILSSVYQPTVYVQLSPH